jgi:hypothetical protein
VAHTVLEARAVISAEDRTAAAFAAIEGRINRLSQAAREVGKVSNSVARATAGIGTQASAIATASRNVGRHIGAGMALAAPIIDHQVARFVERSLKIYREFDKERRYAKAVMGLTDEQQEPLVRQAIHGGANSKFNDIQWLEGQRELAARGLNVDQVMALTEIASKLGQAMDKSLPDSVKALEGAMFGFGKDISTYDRAVANARRTADLQVKASKISGMNYDDLVQAYKYGAIARLLRSRQAREYGRRRDGRRGARARRQPDKANSRCPHRAPLAGHRLFEVPDAARAADGCREFREVRGSDLWRRTR